MPLFDFQCRSCRQTFEMLTRSSDTPACPYCGSDRVDKLIGSAAVHGKTKALLQKARTQAAREGHFSHYSGSERPTRRR